MQYSSVINPDYWRDLNPELTLASAGGAGPVPLMPVAPERHDARWKAHLVNEGYLQFDGAIPSEIVEKLRRGILRLRERGWIPVFAYVYDEYWNLFRGLQALLEATLGPGFRMLPDFWAWYVDHEKSEFGWAPHRDKMAVNPLFPDGMPKSVTVWISLTNATPLNGCMYLIPANQDQNYLNFSGQPKGINLQGVRALTAPAGSVLLWNQRVFHWGGRSSDRSSDPRISLAFEFQRGDIPPYNTPLVDPAMLPALDFRLRLIGKQILQYTHMYGYSEELVAIARRLATGDVPDSEASAVSFRAGRNESCPCGSGKKFKHCHGVA